MKLLKIIIIYKYLECIVDSIFRYCFTSKITKDYDVSVKYVLTFYTENADVSIL